MSLGPKREAIYAWLEGDNLKFNRLATDPHTADTAVVVDARGDYDSVSDPIFSKGVLKIIARKSSDERPDAFISTDDGATWAGPYDVD